MLCYYADLPIRRCLSGHLTKAIVLHAVPNCTISIRWFRSKERAEVWVFHGAGSRSKQDS
jgi:hypothetical protein